MLNFRDLKTKRQIKNALLDMFKLKKIGTFWFKDKNDILSIRISSSKGKVFLNINLPQKFKAINPNQIKYGLGYQFDRTELYDTVIARPSNEELEQLITKGQRLYFCPDVNGHIKVDLLLGWLKVFPDAVLTTTPESEPKYVLLKSEFGCAFIYIPRKKK